LVSGVYLSGNVTESLGAQAMPGRGPFFRQRMGYSSFVWTDDEENGLPGAPEVDDFVQPMPRKQLPKQLLPSYPAVTTVVLSTIAIILVTLIDWQSSHGSFAASRSRVFENSEPLTLVLSMLSHANGGHLLSNLLGFMGFGFLLKRSFGMLAFPVAPAIVGVITTLLTILSTPASQGIIGSSGIVFAMVGQYVTLYFIFENRHSAVTKTVRIIGFLLLLFFPHEYSASTSYIAHAYGFFAGIIAALILTPYVRHNLDEANQVESPAVKQALARLPMHT
jgi:membrane associated rhomboid family serine protease